MNKTALMESQTKEKAAEKAMKRIREEKSRRKDDKSVDHVLKALDNLGTTEEKLGAMCQKYAEMFNDHRLLQNAVKQAEKKNTLLQKEKEQLQAEHSKAILTRSRLENLCRELQRQNKAVKEECMLKMREEGEKKREVAAKFHSMLSEIGSLLAQNSDKNAKLRDDNLDMSMRLKSVCDQFEKKEQHVENLAKQMQLEMQLADAKLAKAKMEMDIEKETLQKEKQQLLIELAEYKRKVCEMTASELALREQITMYSEKYEEFHKALLQSNSAIGDFKAEMERMTKHIRRLEKETATWKSRYDAAQRTLAEVTEGKIRSDEALGLAQRRLFALQGICRKMHDQCRELRGEKKDDQQTEEDYKRLEAQLQDEGTPENLDCMTCPRRGESCDRTDDEKSGVIKNEIEKPINLESNFIAEDVAAINSEKNILDENFTVLHNLSQEKDLLENHIDIIVTQTNIEEIKEESRLKVEDDVDNSLLTSCIEENTIDNPHLENGEIEDRSNLTSCDLQKDTIAIRNDDFILKENNKPEIGIEICDNENIGENGVKSSNDKSIKILPELNNTLKSHDVEIIVPNSPNNLTKSTSNELSLSLNHLKYEEKVMNSAGNDNISILGDGASLKESIELNGEKKSLNNCCDEVMIENSNKQETNSNKIRCSPENVSQSKSKKKRKMKK